MVKGFYVGIDLGTTYSVVSYINEKGVPEIIPVIQDSSTIPSAVYISDSGKLSIGEDAKYEQKRKGQVATFYKRNIGQDTEDYYLEDGKAYSAVQLSSMFLKEVIEKVEEKMNRKVKGAVITVPAYFTEHEKSNTKKAAKMAGIDVMHMVNEPTAAAVAYGLDKADNKKILVYDLGGGTFDVSVAEIKADKIKIVATTGHFQLGGKDWDIEICNWVAEQFSEEFGDDFSSDIEQMDSLMVDAEKLKRGLTTKSEAKIKVKYEGNSGVYTLSEKEFRSRTRHLLERTGGLINEMFHDNHMSWNDIDDIILVGGSTRMKMVSDYLLEISGKAPRRGINPDEAVSMGAALIANSIAEKRENFSLFGSSDPFVIGVGNKKIEDVNSHSLGLIVAREEEHGQETYRVFYNEIMIPKNTSIEKATVTKQFILNSTVQDIYLTQWESDKLPESSAIIGKYQVRGITPDKAFSVTYFHNADTTVNIKAEQFGRSLTVEKVLNHADREFSPELIKKAARGTIMVAIDLSGSMCVISDYDSVNTLIERLNQQDRTLTTDELEQIKLIVKWVENFDKYSKDDDMKAYREAERLSADMWHTAIGMTKQFVIDFVKKFPLENISFGIVGFADKIKSFCDITNDERTIIRAVNELAITKETGECNEAQPMDYMFDILSRKKANANLDFAYAVVLTDGYWDEKAEKEALRAKNKYVRNGIEIVVQGFGEAKESFIANLATLRDLSGVGEISELGNNLSNIAKVISDSNTFKR